MKKFLGRNPKKDESPAKRETELEPTISNTPTYESQDSIRDLQPMFVGENSEPTGTGSSNSEATGVPFTNDPQLNLNPVILNSGTTNTSIFTRDSNAALGKSIFSRSGKSFSTKQSSYFSNKSSEKQQSSDRTNYEGQRLKILDIPEEPKSALRPGSEVISDKIHGLYEDISFVMNQYSNSLVNLTTSVINSIDCLKTFVTFIKDNYAASDDSWAFDTYNNTYLRKLVKIYLNLHDNLLRDEVYIKLKLLLIKNFTDFAMTLNSSTYKRVLSSGNTGSTNSGISKPQNYSIGINRGKSLPNQDVLSNIISKITNTSLSIKEQNGSFIAPITRGISKELNILCLYFGHPNPTDYHLHLIQRLHDLYDDIHFISMTNQIDLASSAKTQRPSQPQAQATTGIDFVKQQPPRNKFKLPFRIPSDLTKPPMSLSLSIENSLRTSGTLGGFVYPMIDIKKKPEFTSYSSYSYAITCGHVCLSNNNEENQEYSNVSVPLSVLISLYKQALYSQYKKFDDDTNSITSGGGVESKLAYGTVLNQLDEIFPIKKVKSANKTSHEVRNFPIHRFGQIVWGERTLLKLEGGRSTATTSSKDDDEFVEKRLSDLAIIKVNKALRCDQNFLGDDIAFNEFDPGLMFDNLYVRSIVDLNRVSNNIDIYDVDSSLSDDEGKDNHGLQVFKYGSTTKFTKGTLNGIKLVYWLDGTIHSSEFVVNSLENNSAFAAGGDSGAWILCKLEDCQNSNESKGLGVVGMLHSYDGEYKQFGLYTPMCEILERLEEVTNIKWGVVGVPEKDINLTSESDVDSSGSSRDDDDDDDDESSIDDMDGAIPPEID